MRGVFPRIFSLALVFFLLSTTNVSAQPMPIMEGSVFKFKLIKTMTCGVYPFDDVFGMGKGEYSIDYEYLIESINYEKEVIGYKQTKEDADVLNKSLSTKQLKGIIHPLIEGDMWLEMVIRSGDITYYSAILPRFIKPDFEEINNLIREDLDREDNNFLDKAIKVEFMGKNSIDSGAEQLHVDNKKWSIYLYFQQTIQMELWDIKVWREWEYSNNGLLKYSIIKKESKRADVDNWCSYDEIYKNTDSIFSFMYGIKVSFFPFLIILILLFLWINRKKIRKNFKKIMA